MISKEQSDILKQIILWFDQLIKILDNQRDKRV